MSNITSPVGGFCTQAFVVNTENFVMKAYSKNVIACVSQKLSVKEYVDTCVIVQLIEQLSGFPCWHYQIELIWTISMSLLEIGGCLMINFPVVIP